MDLLFSTASVVGLAAAAVGVALLVLARAGCLFVPVRSGDAASLGFHGLLGTSTVLGWIIFLFGLALALQPTILGILIGIALVITIVLTTLQRVRADRDAFAAAVTAVIGEGGKPADAARAFGASRRDTLAVRARTFADVCDSGVPPLAAAIRSGLPMTGTLQASLQRPEPPLQLPTGDEPVWSDADPTEAAFTRLLYCAMAISVLSGLVAAGLLFLHTVMVPMFQEILEEFSVEPAAWQHTVDDVLLSSSLILLLIAATTSAAVFLRWIAAIFGWQWLGARVPLFGRIWRVRRRATALQLIARCVSLGHSSRAIEAAARASGDAGVAKSIHRLVEALDSGMHLAAALRHSRLIRGSEQAWVHAAESTERSGRVLAEIAASHRRRTAHRTYLLTEAAIPAFVLGLQIPIALAGILVFDSLAAMIEVMHAQM